MKRGLCQQCCGRTKGKKGRVVRDSGKELRVVEIKEDRGDGMYMRKSTKSTEVKNCRARIRKKERDKKRCDRVKESDESGQSSKKKSLNLSPFSPLKRTETKKVFLFYFCGYHM